MSSVDFKTMSREMAGREGARNSTLLFLIILLFAALGYWASVTELDNVTRGQGKIVAPLQNQQVQAAESGVVLRRYAEENARVSEGDVLYEIDPTQATSELERTLQRYAALRIKEIRLESEIAGETPEIPADLKAQAPTVAANEESLYQARLNELNGALSILDQKLEQRQQQLENARVSVRTAENTEALLQREIAVIEPLVQQNIAPETRLFELQRQLETNRGSREQAITEIAQAEAGITEIRNEIENKREAYTLTSMDELSTVVTEKAELEKILPALEDRVGRTVVRAPVDGIINRIAFRTAGGFVSQGDVMAEIVPTGEDLIIEGRIAPKDISNIRVDDLVRIRLSAYDSSRYGTVDGRVTEISADAIPGEQEGQESYYLIDVAIEGTIETETGETVEFLPGMTATIDVLSGKRTILEYLWQPVARVQELALRD